LSPEAVIQENPPCAVSSLSAVFGVLILTSAVGAQQGALQTAADKLGVAKIKTLQVTGSGAKLLGRTELHELRSLASASR
jgi:hypothetical protein